MDEVIYIPFRYYLKPNSSTFAINIPRQNQNDFHRYYYFSQLSLIPEFFNKEAIAFNLETTTEGFAEVVTTATLEFQFFSNLFSFESAHYLHPADIKEIGHIITSFNNYFELHRPPGIAQCSVFLDWQLNQAPDVSIPHNEFYQLSAELLYGESYIQKKHFNALPESVRNLDSNNFLFPTVTNEEILSEVRVVINIAPNTKVSFSNEKLLVALGFSLAQLGDRRGNRYHLENKHSFRYTRLVAANPPEGLKQAPSGSPIKVFLSPVNEIFTSPSFSLKTTKLHSRDPALFAKDWNRDIQEAALLSNIAFGLEYDNDRKLFLFKFPNNNLLRVGIRLPLATAKQMGFGDERITERSSSQKVLSENDITNYESKAKAIVYDAGMLIVTFDNMRSNTTTGTLDQYMGSLYPEEPGVFTKHESRVSPSVLLPRHSSDLYFNLFTIKNQNTSPLNWTIGAYVQGEMIGKL